MFDNNLFEQLENDLLHTDFSDHPELLQGMLGDDFFEIAPDGTRHERNDVIAWLLNKDNAMTWCLSEFKTTLLENSCVLVNYHGKRTHPENPDSRGATHSSIWKNTDSGWQMIFHQSTAIK